MDKVPISEFRKMDKETLLAIRPCILTFDGEEIGTFVAQDGVVVIEGMHPAVQIQFRGKEALIRASMGNASYNKLS